MGVWEKNRGKSDIKAPREGGGYDLGLTCAGVSAHVGEENLTQPSGEGSDPCAEGKKTA